MIKNTFFVFAVLTALALSTLAQTKAPSTGMLLPADFFPGFPKVEMGMKFAAVKAAIEKTRTTPGGFRKDKAELVWDGTFDGVLGRGTVLLKPRTGVWEIAVVLWAMDDRAAIYDRYLKKIKARHGKPSEIHDDEIAVSNVWRLKNGMAIELRSPKDINSPVVDIHWVKL
jgi:hypothetical protein